MKGTHKKIPPTTNNLRETELRRRKFNKHHQPYNQRQQEISFFFMWNPNVKASRHVESSERASQISRGAVGWVRVDFGSTQFSSGDYFECQNSAGRQFSNFWIYFSVSFETSVNAAGSSTVNAVESNTRFNCWSPKYHNDDNFAFAARASIEDGHSFSWTLNTEFCLFLIKINTGWLTGKTRWWLQELETRVESLDGRAMISLSISGKCEWHSISRIKIIETGGS